MTVIRACIVLGGIIRVSPQISEIMRIKLAGGI